MAVLALNGSGCAAVIIGAGVAGAAGAGYAYYKGDAQFDLAAPFDASWTATLAALQDLQMPIQHHGLGQEHGEIETTGPEQEAIHLQLEPVTTPQGVVTRLHIRVGVFGSKSLSDRIHAQILNRLQHLPTAPPAVVSPANVAPTTPPIIMPTGARPPVETAPPPLADAPKTATPAVGTTSPTNPIVPVVNSPGPPSVK